MWLKCKQSVALFSSKFNYKRMTKTLRFERIFQ
jgi:hypothetical protein